VNPFHEHLCNQLEQRLAKRRVVVFYDPSAAFAPFFGQAPLQGDSGSSGLERVMIGTQSTLVARYDGSFFGLRAAVEPVVAKDEPDPLILYLPGVNQDQKTSVLMELELGGTSYKPELKRLARYTLRQLYTDGEIDGMLASEALTYADVVSYFEQASSGGRASVLKTVLRNSSDEALLVQWLADGGRDARIVEKAAVEELYRLVETRIGLFLAPETTVGEARRKVVRYLLVNEFRANMEGESPTSVGLVPVSPSDDHDGRIHGVNNTLRRQHPDRYAAFADGVEAELELARAAIDPSWLGSTDTFRFEEQRLLGRAIELAAAKQYDAALDIVVGRAQSFWLDRDVARRAQWEACRLAAELGREAARVAEELESRVGDATAWVSAYSATGGWFEVDRLRRHLETLVTQLDDEPEGERAIAVVRRAHEELLKQMAVGFSAALADVGWTVPKVLHQTHTYPDVVQAGGPRVAYLMVDAMRYEMGVELGDQLQGAQELVVRPAVAALPTITPIGMAALLPGAAASFSVVDHRGRLAAGVEGAVLSELKERQRFLESRVPGVVDIKLEEVLETSARKLSSAIKNASLIVVRSQELDLLGETSDLLARNFMDTSIGNVARAVRRLASAGVESFVIAADHGHQFSLRKGQDMRADSPGGETVALHRRCWAGRGGSTPPGTVRVSGVALGYDTDLDFVFPTGLGVFKAGGGLSYHHGGFSLQELVVPVLSFRIPRPSETTSQRQAVQLADAPRELTNRTFGVRLAVVGDLLATEPIAVRIVLISGDRHVGQAGMAQGADFDRDSGVLTMEPGSEANVGVMLTVEDCESVRLVVQDPATDVVLAQSEEIPVRLGI
jgi:hypothetical protein